MNNVRAVLLAGGRGLRMGKLSSAFGLKPLVPFGGVCRLVDFSLDNARLSGLSEVLLLSQHNEVQLIRYVLAIWNSWPGFRVHLGPYDGCTLEDCETVVTAVRRPEEKGTADALIKNSAYLFGNCYSELLVLHADHVYRCDYGGMIQFHRKSAAALTIGYQRIERRYVKLFGMVRFDSDHNLIEFIEKPQHPTSDMIFSAVCIFDSERLRYYLAKLSRGSWQYDISRDVIPAMLAAKERIKGYPFYNYWEDIGTIERYWRAQWRLLEQPPSLRLDGMPHTIRPEMGRRHIGAADGIRNAIVPDDLENAGRIENAIVYPDVYIGAGAEVRNSVLLSGARVLPDSRIDSAIVLENEVVTGWRVHEFLPQQSRS